VILIFHTLKSVEEIFQGKFTLGADSGTAADPVGRRVEGATDLGFKADIHSYSRSRGWFAGVSLEGVSVLLDAEANQNYHHKLGITPRMILVGMEEDQPLAGKRLLMKLQEIMGGLGHQGGGRQPTRLSDTGRGQTVSLFRARY